MLDAMEGNRGHTLKLTARVGQCVPVGSRESPQDAFYIQHFFTTGIGITQGDVILSRLTGLPAGTDVTEFTEEREVLWGQPQVTTVVSCNTDTCKLDVDHMCWESLKHVNLIHSGGTPSDIHGDIRIDLMKGTSVPEKDLPISIHPDTCSTMMKRIFTLREPSIPGYQPIQYIFSKRWQAPDFITLMNKRKNSPPVAHVTLAARDVASMSPVEFGMTANSLVLKAAHLLHPEMTQRYTMFE